MAATIRDVARQAGVSTATVSRLINHTAPVAKTTRRRIEIAIRKLDYHPNAVARSLVTATTRTIAILLPDITNPFFPDLVKGVQLLAEERHHTLLLLNTQGDPTKEESSLVALRGRQIDGVILVGVVMEGKRILRTLGRKVPIVVLDRVVEGLETTVVALDNPRAARLATRHLLDLGHRAIVHITGPRTLLLTQQRLEAYRRTLREAGITPDPDLVADGDFTEEGGYQAARRLLDRGVRFTALFAANDLSAIGAISAFKARGMGVPDDVSVAGVDDIRLSAYTTPALTTIRQPTYEMGRRAAEVLIDSLLAGRLPAPGTILFEPELIARESTTRPPTEAS